jgi:hypothetical protein
VRCGVDAEKAARIVRLVFYTGLAVANAPHRPAWLAGPRRAQGVT